MANLKEKILQALQNGEKVEHTLDYLTRSQENLLKNYSNPVFNQKDRGKLLKSYTNLQDVWKSLYRYGALMDNNYFADAQEEKDEIEDTVLKGGVVYYHYVWHSENGENTCDECKKLDGQVFEMDEEIPERPHPNCRCTVEIVEDEIETDGEESQDDKDKIPPRMPTPQPPNPQPTPKPEPTPQPKTPPQTQKWILPVSKGHKITSKYGYRMHPVKHVMALHDGIDINALANTPVYAVADGTVSVAGWISGYGNYIQIEHANGLSSFYAHLNKINVSKGSVIRQGQNIALSGNTGIGTGPHLHFGVKKNGKSDNPEKYLPGF